MNYEYTNAAEASLNQAHVVAAKFGGIVETAHILYGLYTSRTGTAYKILEKNQVDEKLLYDIVSETHDIKNDLLNSGDNVSIL